MNSIDDGLYLDIGGLRQWVSVRGRDTRNPALLFLSGPGAGFSAAAPYFAPWEARYTVVQWDQPGAGYTVAANPADDTPLSYERIARDGVEVAAALKGRFGLERLAILATSGGTVTGLAMARARPDLFCGYIGTGQIVNRAAQEQLSYRMVLDRARATGDLAGIAELEGIGPPPYADLMGDLVKSKYANAPTPAEAAAFAELMALDPPKPDARHAPAGLAAPDGRANGLAAYQATAAELAAFDARSLGRSFGLPMHVIQGEDDAHTVTSEVIPWAREVGASLALIPGAGHLSVFLREPMLAEMSRVLRG